MTRDEYEALPEWVRWAVEIMRSEQMMWLMAGSNYIELNLSDIREGWKCYRDAGGPTWRDGSDPWKPPHA